MDLLVMMTKFELIEWYKTIPSEKMPQYIDAMDANNAQLLVDGEWKNIVFFLDTTF